MKRLHKKITALCLSLSLCAAVLAGCGAPKQVSTETQAEVSTQAPAPAETQEAAQTENDPRDLGAGGGDGRKNAGGRNLHRAC